MSNEVTRSSAEAHRPSTDTVSARRSNRRSFLKNTMAAGAAATPGSALLSKGVPAFAQDKSGSLRKGADADAARR